MPTHNLLEYKKITKKAAGSLWNYYRDEPSIPESFKYKTGIAGNTYDGDDDADKIGKNEVVVPLKNLSNFYRT